MPQHNEVYLTESFRKRWEDIIENIDITNVPIEYIDHLILHDGNGNEHVVSVIDLLAEGVDPQDLEEELSYRIESYNDVCNGLSIDYVLNVEKVTEDIQTSTNKVLKNL